MKNKKTKLTALALALALSSVPVAATFADTTDNYQQASAYKYNIEDKTLTDVKTQARELRQSLLDLGSFSPYLDLLNKIVDIINSFDIKSSGPRLNLASDSLEAILVATRDLTNKTESVHRDIGFAVTRAVIVLADPFASIDKIASTSENLKEIVSRAKQSPDITENDIATVYKKEKIAKLIAESRSYRLHNLIGKEYSKLRNELNSAITKAVLTQLKNRVSVGQIDKAYKDLSDTLDKVREEKIPIAIQVEAKKALDDAKNKANKELIKARSDQKAKINRIKEVTLANRSSSKREVDKIFRQAKDDIKKATTIEDVEGIKNIALEKILDILPLVEASEDIKEVELPEDPKEEIEIKEETKKEADEDFEEETNEEIPKEAIDEAIADDAK